MFRCKWRASYRIVASSTWLDWTSDTWVRCWFCLCMYIYFCLNKTESRCFIGATSSSSSTKFITPVRKSTKQNSHKKPNSEEIYDMSTTLGKYDVIEGCRRRAEPKWDALSGFHIGWRSSGNGCLHIYFQTLHKMKYKHKGRRTSQILSCCAIGIMSISLYKLQFELIFQEFEIHFEPIEWLCFYVIAV